jgi:hypothetical protein
LAGVGLPQDEAACKRTLAARHGFSPAMAAKSVNRLCGSAKFVITDLPAAARPAGFYSGDIIDFIGFARRRAAGRENWMTGISRKRIPSHQSIVNAERFRFKRTVAQFPFRIFPLRGKGCRKNNKLFHVAIDIKKP